MPNCAPSKPPELSRAKSIYPLIHLGDKIFHQPFGAAVPKPYIKFGTGDMDNFSTAKTGMINLITDLKALN